MKRLWFYAIGGVVAATAALGGVKAAQIGAMIKGAKAFKPPPESVTSAKVEALRWQESRPAVATLVAVRAVTVSSELPGLVREIHFDSGAFVRRGEVLIKLDTSTEEAQLSAADADATLASVTRKRVRMLVEQNSSTQSELDVAEARAEQTAANVTMLKATIAKKTIRAPFDGRISIRQVELGQVVAPGTPIASLQSVSPIHADFWVPQQAVADLKPGQRVSLRTDAFPEARWDGDVTTVNPEVDAATRNVRVRATFANPDGRLRPGMYANVDVVSGAPRETLQIPATAVIYAPYGDSVFAIAEKADAKGHKALVAQQKFVRLGERRGDFVAVVSGLTAGEKIVGSGAFKLRNGMPVAVNDALAPGTAELAPRPADQ